MLEIVEAGETLAETVYRVRFLCCGRVDLMAHYSLRQRHLRFRRGCGICQSRGRKQVLEDPGEPDYYPSVEILDIDGRARAWPISIGKLGPRFDVDGEVPVSQRHD